MLKQNGYSNGDIAAGEKLLKKRCMSSSAEEEGEKRKEKEKHHRVTLDYLGRVSHRVERILKKEGVEVGYRKGMRIGTLVNTRRDVPVKEMDNVVYKIECGGKECKKEYIGETSQKLSERIKQHKRAVKNGDTNNALCVHALETGHLPNWEAVSILEKEKNTDKRKFKEAWCIKNNQNSVMNLNKGVQFEYLWNCLG